MEAEPHSGQNWMIRMSPTERRRLRGKIIAGGKIADKIRRMAIMHHEAEEIPAAEQEIDQNLNAVTTSEAFKSSKAVSSQRNPSKLSLWQRILNFFRRLFLP